MRNAYYVEKVVTKAPNANVDTTTNGSWENAPYPQNAKCGWMREFLLCGYGYGWALCPGRTGG